MLFNINMNELQLTLDNSLSLSTLYRIPVPSMKRISNLSILTFDLDAKKLSFDNKIVFNAFIKDDLMSIVNKLREEVIIKKMQEMTIL